MYKNWKAISKIASPEFRLFLMTVNTAIPEIRQGMAKGFPSVFISKRVKPVPRSAIVEATYQVRKEDGDDDRGYAKRCWYDGCHALEIPVVRLDNEGWVEGESVPMPPEVLVQLQNFDWTAAGFVFMLHGTKMVVVDYYEDECWVIVTALDCIDLKH